MSDSEESNSELTTPERTVRLERRIRIREQLQMDQLRAQFDALQQTLQTQLATVQQDAAQQRHDFEEEKKQMAEELAELKSQQVNQQMVTTNEMKQAENTNYFQDVFVNLVYPLGANLANAANWQLKQWDDYLNSYSPKLEAKMDAATWFGVYENSCGLQDIPINKRYKKLISTILSPTLRAKLVKKQDFFAGAANDTERYERIRKWLCTDEKMMKSVNDTEKAIKEWSPTKETLALNYDDFVERIDSYIYSIRFAVSHGINQSRFDLLSESFLFKLFVRKTKQDKIRQEAEKFTSVRNVSTLQKIVQQLNKEISIPTEYKNMKPTASLMYMTEDDNEGDMLYNNGNEDLLYMRENPGRYSQAPGGYLPPGSQPRDKLSRSNKPRYGTGLAGKANNKNSNEWYNTAPFCQRCYMHNHEPKDCIKRSYDPQVDKLIANNDRKGVATVVEAYRKEARAIAGRQRAQFKRRGGQRPNSRAPLNSRSRQIERYNNRGKQQLYHMEHLPEYEDVKEQYYPSVSGQINDTQSPQLYYTQYDDIPPQSKEVRPNKSSQQKPVVNNIDGFSYSYPRRQ